VMDPAYVEFDRLFALQDIGAFFVTRVKSNFKCRRLYSMPVDRNTGLVCDQHVELTFFYSKQGYPEFLRRIRYNDAETGKRLTFLTNYFGILALSVCALHKNRWQVELFFKWIKQNLRIKPFYGTSENAVKSQIWIAISVYVLIAIVKKRLHLETSLQTLLQILSLTVFDKLPLQQALTVDHSQREMSEMTNQLNLFQF
jgi:hypothetical protein